MRFTYKPVRVRETRSGPRFRVGRLTEIRDRHVKDVSHLVDRSYDYASSRELRWHLAERFQIPVEAVSLSPR